MRNSRQAWQTFVLICFLLTIFQPNAQSQETRFESFTTAPSRVQLYWKDDVGRNIKSLGGLKMFVEGQGHKLLFAMNGGMYLQDHSPQGLFIQLGKVIKPLNALSGPSTNFYLLPNGVFYTRKDGQAFVCETAAFKKTDDIQFATQSGPMLLIDGALHPAFKKGSSNMNIRNGVGILPNGNVIFVISKEPVNFYDFAEYFKAAGCKNALYLDGFVSRMYLPEKNWTQSDGEFGVIIGVTE